MTPTRSESSSGTRSLAALASSSPASGMPRRLAIALRPVDGENVHGYLRRLADANGHNFLDTFLHALGFRGTVGPMGRDDMWHRLAAWTELPVWAFDSMRWRPTAVTGRPALSVLGSTFTRALVHPRSMQFCPSCLRSDGIRRDFWSLAYVVACPLHSCLLVDVCTACQKRFDTSPIGSPLACQCGERFDQKEVQVAPSFALRIARNLALMTGEQTSVGVRTTNWKLDLPAEFAEIGANDYMAYLDVIGTAATTPAEEDPRVVGPPRRYDGGTAVTQPAIPITLARIDAAMPIMDGWPAMLYRLLDDLRGRGDGPDAVDLASAFPTRVGRSLLRPRRGLNGLPLHLIHEAVDQYWQLHGSKSYRKRNLTVESAVALKLHTHFNATTLAVAVGDHQATEIHSRILRRVLDEMSLEEIAVPPADVAELALQRSVNRYNAVVAAVTGHAAARIIEGRAAKGTLSGWNHPDLLPVDPTLQGLRYKASPIYLSAGVCDALERLQAVSRRPTGAQDLSPLVSVAMKLAPLRPWYGKTALLLDVMNGTVPVYAAVDRPRLNDLFVDLPLLRDHIAARNPSLLTEYATLAKVNARLLMQFGPGSSIGLHSARRLVRTRSVDYILEKSKVSNRERPVVKRLYRIDDMIAVAGREKAQRATANGEGMTGVECDVTERVARLLRDGNSMRATACALTRSGLSTINGAQWTHHSVCAAMARSAAGQRITAIRTALPIDGSGS